MREIKFRGRTLDDEWVYGYLADPIHIVVFNGPMHAVVTEIMPETVGQFTGLKDKNGKEIYEGDLLDFEMIDLQVGLVLWSPERAAFVVKVGKLSYDFNINLNRILTIIGNIYKNPEILR